MDEIVVKVHVKTGCRDNALHYNKWNGSLEVSLKAKPIKGKANAELISFLSDHFHIDRNAIKIISGLTGHFKYIQMPKTLEIEKILK
ncbi:MAG: DUF167 domain-containing protein [Thermoplasmata archaeon]